MDIHKLTALSPLDGRYDSYTESLKPIFSEFGLIKFRTLVEVRWLLALAANNKITEIQQLSTEAKQILEDIYTNFDIKNATEIKTIEQKTKHDVKAIEYFLQQKCSVNKELTDIVEFIHFGCTSEDINNLAYGLMLKSGLNNILIPKMQQIIDAISNMANKYAKIAMLSRTHGQTASPTTVGKEMANFAYRLKQQLANLKQIKILGKINGAVGNYNAHLIAYPQIDWLQLSQDFIEDLGLNYNPYTTQIEPHDYMANIFNIIQQFNCILLDFTKDIWGYISLGYFKQKVVAGEVGSSTMPHKVNPINFENAEGNLGLTNAIMQHFAMKLPISRWQRDLTDSTVLRNIGIAIGYSLLAYESTLIGIAKLEVNQAQLQYDLNNSWEVIAEAIQTVMRRYKIANPYEKLKQLTRGITRVTPELLHGFIAELDLPEDVKTKLQELTPLSYTGSASFQAQQLNSE